jgi:hypothetical protein
MKRLSVRYLAGLVDGEGCIDFQRGFNKGVGQLYIRPRVRITMVDGLHLLPNIQNNFGGHCRINDRSNGNENWQPATTWSISSKHEVQKFLSAIVNHLIIKKEQAKFALWYLNRLQGIHKRSKGSSRITEARNLVYEEIKLMKRDPQRLSERAAKRILDECDLH